MFCSSLSGPWLRRFTRGGSVWKVPGARWSCWRINPATCLAWAAMASNACFCSSVMSALLFGGYGVVTEGLGEPFLPRGMGRKNPLESMAPRVGIEPTTNGLTVRKIPFHAVLCHPNSVCKSLKVLESLSHATHYSPGEAPEQLQRYCNGKAPRCSIELVSGQLSVGV